MWGSLNVPFDVDFEEHPGYEPRFTRIPLILSQATFAVNVIWAGPNRVLRSVLAEFIGVHRAKHIDVVPIDAEISTDWNQFEVVWKNDTALEHDKASSIQEARTFISDTDNDTPLLVIFVGDGVSDLTPYENMTFFFSCRGLRSEEYSKNKTSPTSFSRLLKTSNEASRITVDGRSEKETGIPKFYNPRLAFFQPHPHEPHNFHCRANFRGRISNTSSVPTLNCIFETAMAKDIPDVRRGESLL